MWRRNVKPAPRLGPIGFGIDRRVWQVLLVAAKKAAKPSHKALGRAINELREEAGLTQAQLSKKTGLHVSYISCLENGSRNPTWTVLSQVSAALKIPISELAQRAEQ
jgi:DNA-binding XRE family transcriptional regulator